ncbi:MAG TPA: FCD domain-containing protein [Anaerolineaceae bacterium]
MNNRFSPSINLSEFLNYLANNSNKNEQLPSLPVISQSLGISVASLREQLQEARALGLVEVKPKTGIKRLRYSFKPAVCRSLSYAVAADPGLFEVFGDLRRHIESAYYEEAVALLTEVDIIYLQSLVQKAKCKLEGTPIQIPHYEHRELHLCIYRKLNNTFVTGLLETYWDLYETIGLNLYTDISYLKKVWEYHEKIVNAISRGELTMGYDLLVDHTNLLNMRNK